jgi:hypothetical protein|tara:strand:- start:6 stop:278 length:273 start_codon:yes stop_codon:yes gene_type:complete
MNWKEILKEDRMPTKEEWNKFIEEAGVPTMIDLPDISYEQFIANEEEAKNYLLQMSKKEDAKVKAFWAKYPNLKPQGTREERYPNLKFKR